MKKLLKKTAAALLSVLSLTALPMRGVYAKNLKDTELPSGLTVYEMQQTLEEDTAMGAGEASYVSAAVSVFQGDDVLLENYYGKINIEDDISASADSVYEWGSITKTLVWVSAMQLWEQGKLDLERDVREYLPEGFFQHLSYDEPITMLNLMNHNAGWQETSRPVWKTEGDEILSLEEELKAIEPAQVNRPGEVAAYSNYGAAVAGLVVECVSGEDFCQYVHKHIFKPLGMEHTALSPDHSDNLWVQEQRRSNRSYKFTLGKLVKLGSRLNYVPAYPAGAATGTLSDLVTFAQALADKDAPLFEDPATQELMFTSTDNYGQSDIPICAHGFWFEEHAVRTVGHSGATTAGQSNMLIDLDSGIGLVVMVNEPDGNQILSEVPELVFGKLPADKYGSGGESADLSGYYIPARSVHKGMLRIMSYLSAMNINALDDTKEIGDGVYQAVLYNGTLLLGEKDRSDGKILQLPSADMICSGGYLAVLSLIAGYFLAAVGAFYLLLIHRRLKKHGRPLTVGGAAVLTAGRWARIASVAALLVMFGVTLDSRGGISFEIGVFFGVFQMFCAAVCTVSAIAASRDIVSASGGNLGKTVCSLHILASVLTIAAIIFFQLYRFWGI